MMLTSRKASVLLTKLNQEPLCSVKRDPNEIKRKGSRDDPGDKNEYCVCREHQ